jgi:enamine deaminase RidA (YjgF/YER057c/UK114 family)
MRAAKGSQFLLAVLLAALACRAARANAAENLLTCIEPDSRSGTSLAVIVDDAPLIHTAQIVSAGHGNAREQTDEVLSKLDSVLKSANANLDRACKLNIYVASEDALLGVRQAISNRFTQSMKPASTTVIGRLPNLAALVAVDAVAVAIGHSEAKPTVENGMRSFAVLPAGPKIYVSGMADTNSLADATRKTLEKLTGAIAHLGLDKKDIVQLKAFLEPMADVNTVRKEIIGFFEGDAPPFVFVEWISPKPNPPIEIELVAPAKGDFSGETNSLTFLTPPGTTDSKVFRRVARVNRGKMIYISGLCSETSVDGRVQVQQVFGSLKRILQQTGSDFEHLVKATYYVTDEDASNKLNEIRPQFYNPDRPPAASKAKVKGVGRPEKTVCMEMIAVTK